MADVLGARAGQYRRMRSLVYFVATSIDGWISGPGGDLGAFVLADDLREWIVAEYPETLPAHVRSAWGVDPPNRRFDTVVMGRATYEPGVAAGVPSPYGHLRQYIATDSMAQAPHPDVRVTADPVTTVRRLKRQQGLDIWLAGGGRTAGALLPEIDELVVKVYPVVVGSGTPLFGGRVVPTALKRVGQRPFGSGAVVLTYRR